MAKYRAKNKSMCDQMLNFIEVSCRYTDESRPAVLIVDFKHDIFQLLWIS